MNPLETAPKNRNIVITGASGGLGTVLCESLLKEGYRSLAFAYCSSGDQLFSMLKAYDLDPARHCFKADLTREPEVKDFVRKSLGTFGTPWALINLAGTSSNAMSWKLSLEDFDNVIKGNLYSTFLTCREFIPSMRESQGGRIINASSVVAQTGTIGASHYCAAKAGIQGYTRALALELASKKITANALAIGYFNYGMIDTVPQAMREQILTKIPANRLGDCDDLKGPIKFLLSDESAYMTGQLFQLNGGLYF